MGDYHAPTYRCGNPETLATAQLNKLRTNRPKVWFEGTLPGWKLADWKALYFEWANKWSKVANVECSEAATRQEAHWIVVPARIDGTNGVLADAHLPGPSQQVNRYDVSDTARPTQLGQTVLHEVGHLYGLVHLESSPPPDVMEASLNPNLFEPQATESKLMASMYGPPKSPAPPPSPTAPGTLTATIRLADNGSSVGCEITAEKPGYVATLKGTKSWQSVAQGLQAGVPIEQPEDFDLPEKWQDDPTDLEPEELT